MIASSLLDCLHDTFEDETLFGFSAIDAGMAANTDCKCSLITVLPYPDLKYMYNPVEYYEMLENLRIEHSEKLKKIKKFLDEHSVKYASPPASPADDGNHRAEFSYKWAAIHAGLGFIGKNDVFVHYKYAQRVRISCLLLDIDLPVFSGDIKSRCGDCSLCVQACPHSFILGRAWNINIKRENLVDYKKCAMKSKHSGEGQNYLCSRCALACTYPDIG